MKKILIIIIVLLFIGILCFTVVERNHYNQLIFAIENCNHDEVETLLDFPYFNLNRQGGKGWILSWLSEIECLTPLQAACKVGDYHTVKAVIEKGADASQIIEGSFSPLYYCLETYHSDDLDIVMLLIENGADPRGIEEGGDINNHSLLQTALLSPDKGDSGKYKEYDEEKAKNILVLYQYLEKHIIDAACAVSDVGETPLMYATISQNLLLMEYLIDNSPICLEQCNEAGENAVFYVVPEEHPYDERWKKDTLNLLCGYSIDINKQNKEGKTAYDYAQEEKDIFLARLLKEKMN